MYPITLNEAVLTTAIEERLATDRRTSFVVGEDAEFLAWFDFANGERAQTLTAVFKKDGAERWRIDIEVGRSPNWRTWVKRRVGKRDAGDWVVEVIDEGGHVYASLPYTVR